MRWVPTVWQPVRQRLKSCHVLRRRIKVDSCLLNDLTLLKMVHSCGPFMSMLDEHWLIVCGSLKKKVMMVNECSCWQRSICTGNSSSRSFYCSKAWYVVCSKQWRSYALTLSVTITSTIRLLWWIVMIHRGSLESDSQVLASAALVVSKVQTWTTQKCLRQSTWREMTCHHHIGPMMYGA